MAGFAQAIRPVRSTSFITIVCLDLPQSRDRSLYLERTRKRCKQITYMSLLISLKIVLATQTGKKRIHLLIDVHDLHYVFLIGFSDGLVQILFDIQKFPSTFGFPTPLCLLGMFGYCNFESLLLYILFTRCLQLE